MLSVDICLTGAEGGIRQVRILNLPHPNLPSEYKSVSASVYNIHVHTDTNPSQGADPAGMSIGGCWPPFPPFVPLHSSLWGKRIRKGWGE